MPTISVNLTRKDAINHHKDAINRRLYEGLMIVETAIHEPARCGVAW